MGKTPITVGPFKVVGMYDLERRTKTYETYDWGLLVEGKTEDVAKMVDALLPVNRRLEFDGCSLSRDWNERS